MSNAEAMMAESATQKVVGLLSQPAQILKEISSKKEDGFLQVIHNEVVWRLHFCNGKLRYANSSFQTLKTLDYHLRCVGFNQFSAANRCLPQAGLMTHGETWLQLGPTSPLINWFCSQGYLNVPQSARLLENLTKEALETFLWLTEGHYQWIQEKTGSDNNVVFGPDLELEEVLVYFQERVQAWQKYSTLIKSPHQRPYLFSQGGSNTNSPDLLKLSNILRGMSIRQLALALNQDELKIAKFLSPFIQRGEVYLRDPQTTYQKLPTIPQIPSPIDSLRSNVKTFKIACVDDSPTILDEMHRFLNHEEYEVTKIDDPVKAAAVLFKLKPDLVLMDITMPEINGYKLCSLLRNSVALRETPIVMVTGRSGLVDKARARVTGATDYLVKPFTRGSLLAVVEKYLH